jgi:type I restriction enzyme S subunit
MSKKFLSPDEQPYPLPNGWQWCRLSKIATLFTGNSINEKIKAEKYQGRVDGLIYIATKDIGFDNQIDYETNIRIPASDNFKIAPANTTLLCIEGGSAGRKIGFTNQAVCFVRLCWQNQANKKYKQNFDKISLKVEECLCQTYFIT